uniref:Odorant receptor n=1 Tax=Anopheles stephensi TaxID=30069 RepID=A0A182YBN8_ANOST
MELFLSQIYRKFHDSELRFANNPDQFVILRYLTFLYAIRCDSPLAMWQRVLWYCHRSGLMLVFSSYCLKAYWHMNLGAYTFPMFNIIGTIWIFGGALVRRMLFDRSVLVRLERFLNDRSFRGDEPAATIARRTVQRQNTRYLVGTALTLLLETFLFSGTNLMLQPEFMLTYRGRVVGGVVVQILYGFATCYWGSLYVLIFSFIYVILNAFRVEMSILVQSFEQINQILHQHCPSVSASETSIAEERKLWKDLRNLLKKNVQRHVELLENLIVFRSILGPFSFVQYYGSFVLIAYYCFIIMYKGITSLTVVYIAFIVFLVVESFLFCHIISNINELNAKIGMVLYAMEWYNKLHFSKRFASDYRHVRSSLLTIAIRTQSPLSFTINGLGTISRGRFVDLLNSSYSFMALMLQLKNEIAS